jgi:hypothetical protein
LGVPVVWLVCGGLAVLLGLAFFHLNPAQYPVFPKCAFHQLTGLSCPGCGGQRALHQLLHGQIVAAFRLNPLLLSLLPLGVVWSLRQAVGRLTGRTVSPLFRHHRWGWVMVGVVVAFWIVRNLPFAPFTWFAA